MDAAVLRECAAAREAVAMMDASTLGKIDVQGPDAAEFLNRLYTNAMDTLKVGRGRYFLMCRADGMVFDDGVALRLADDRFLTTTTTGNAAAVLDWMEEWLQTEWPDLRVHLTSVTEQLATVAVVGPRARDLLAPLVPDLDLSAEGFPFMAAHDAAVGGLAARIARVSFSGELAFEVTVPGFHGLELWRTLWASGEPFGVTAYGTETMHVLRAEKGYVDRRPGDRRHGHAARSRAWTGSCRRPSRLRRQAVAPPHRHHPRRPQAVGRPAADRSPTSVCPRARSWSMSTPRRRLP